MSQAFTALTSAGHGEKGWQGEARIRGVAYLDQRGVLAPDQGKADTLLRRRTPTSATLEGGFPTGADKGKAAAVQRGAAGARAHTSSWHTRHSRTRVAAQSFAPIEHSCFLERSQHQEATPSFAYLLDPYADPKNSLLPSKLYP
eukprot:COSAG01_NODE_9591_length_2399_cov_3.761739_1_plen_143_part_10